MVKNEKPQLEFILSLNKIKDIYNDYEDLEDKDNEIQDLCYHYEKKEKFSNEDLIKLEIKCGYSWNKVLLNICNNIINKCEQNKKNQKLFAKELRDAKKIKGRLINNNLKVGDYEQIYYYDLQKLKDDFDSKVEKEKIEWKRFIFGMLIGFVLGLIGGFIIKILLG